MHHYISSNQRTELKSGEERWVEGNKSGEITKDHIVEDLEDWTFNSEGEDDNSLLLKIKICSWNKVLLLGGRIVFLKFFHRHHGAEIFKIKV